MKRATFTIKLTARKHWAEAQLVGWPGEFEIGASPRKALDALMERLDHSQKVLGKSPPSSLHSSAKQWLEEMKPMYKKIKDYRL